MSNGRKQTDVLATPKRQSEKCAAPQRAISPKVISAIIPDDQSGT